MKYMLDTNTCIDIIRAKRFDIIDKFNEHLDDGFCISAIVYSELLFGVQRSSNPEKNRHALDMFLSPIEVLDYPTNAAVHCARIHQRLSEKGQLIGPNDLLIAAHCLVESCILVTSNENEFKRVPDLIVQNWVGNS